MNPLAQISRGDSWHRSSRSVLIRFCHSSAGISGENSDLQSSRCLLAASIDRGPGLKDTPLLEDHGTFRAAKLERRNPRILSWSSRLAAETPQSGKSSPTKPPSPTATYSTCHSNEQAGPICPPGNIQKGREQARSLDLTPSTMPSRTSTSIARERGFAEILTTLPPPLSAQTWSSKSSKRLGNLLLTQLPHDATANHCKRSSSQGPSYAKRCLADPHDTVHLEQGNIRRVHEGFTPTSSAAQALISDKIELLLCRSPRSCAAM